MALAALAPFACAQWTVSGSNIFYNNGNVGIGTNNPVYRLFVQTPTGATAIFGNQTATTGTVYGVWGQIASTTGAGVYGYALSTTGNTWGVYGRADSTTGIGVYGFATATTGGTFGVWGRSASTAGTGVYGYATATTGSTLGVWGRADSTAGIGVYGFAPATTGITYGVQGRNASTAGAGVYGFAAATTGAAHGVLGVANNDEGFAVFAQGDAGASGMKSFCIDHPLRPETHYLYHYCTEAPEPLNAYSGIVQLDARGEAWVQLPDYFDALNRDPRYTLTPIGAPMPNLHVAVEASGNRFKIAGGAPNQRVSWRVEATRNDPYVQRRGFRAEREKPREHQGKYLHPELYGQPKERAIHPQPTETRLQLNP
ncbi:MAG: hypothetical protein NZ556_05375 [Fimbriimonadales bacterium]|nr:hypothetical protein [Fimbriimonadales bacterium]